ncbi:hypothetical protein [Pleurocapsa sp. FMAR1]|uniref:hypothetical protein n=1 Tax=Pleurocapsa sp. FMAR1 TaxID=3040204 RepID=UPI0029C8952E|nr:hypothetical protein [Pleurocapsa sp. FMAR1]
MENEYSRSQQRSGTWRGNLAVSSAQNRNQSNLVFALAHELQQYIETNAAQQRSGTSSLDGSVSSAQFDPNIYDNINHWRAGILSQGTITDENLLEIIGYIGAEKLQELIELASSKIAS